MKLSKLIAPRLKSQNNFSELNSLRTSKLLEELSFLYNFSGEGYVKLPLVSNVERKIRNLLENEIMKRGFQEINLPVIQAQTLWEKSNRFSEFKDFMFVFDNKAIFPTTEEPIADFLSNVPLSYRELPTYIYGFRTLFRRTRETLGARASQFQILDMYSIDPSHESLESTMHSMIIPFFTKLFEDLGIQIYPTWKGSDYLDFRILTSEGDDKIYVRREDKKLLTFDKPEEAGAGAEETRSFSVAVVMYMGTKYSEQFGVTHATLDNSKRPAYLGGYAIGIERLVYSLVDQKKTLKNGSMAINWPKGLHPFESAVIPVEPSNLSYCKEVYDRLCSERVDTLLDDTQDRIGVKSRRAYAIGIPTLLIVGPKEQERGTITVVTLGGYKYPDLSLEEYLNLKETLFRS